MSTPVNHAYEASIVTHSLYRKFQSLQVCESMQVEDTLEFFSCLDEEHVSAGTTLYEAGSCSEQKMHLIIEGMVSVTTPGSNLCSQLAEGDLFGLFSFLDEQRHHAATVVAISDLKLLTINRATFDLISVEEPQMGNRMLRFMFHLLAGKTLNYEHEYALMHAFAKAGQH